MPAIRATAIEFAHKNRDRFLDELSEFLRIPSISTSEEHQPAIQKAAEWVAGQLTALGIQKVEIFQTPGHPIVYGEYLQAGKDKPIVLVYGHYDVQPPDPLELWKSDPFDPKIRDQNLYARGASDMKGQVIASLKAIESIMALGDFPVNLKFLIEGEEEIGSPSLGKFLRDHKDLLASDVALNPDTGMIAPDVPTIVYGLRGLAYFELRVFGPDHDLHSGVFGGVVHNPAQALCTLLAGMKDDQGRITLPGFYDRVRPISPEEHIEVSRLTTDAEYYLKQTGAPAIFGEVGYLPAELVGARPTLDVNGLLSGFTGKGSKTIIPAWAMAKISMRLVPDQDPDEVHQQLVQYLELHAPDTIRWELTKMSGGPACMTDIHTPAVKALYSALETVWGKSPVYKREGGSVPIVADMQKVLGIQSVLTGFGLPDDNIHSPNEKLDLNTWFRGIDALIHFFFNLAEQVK